MPDGLRAERPRGHTVDFMHQMLHLKAFVAMPDALRARLEQYVLIVWSCTDGTVYQINPGAPCARGKLPELSDAERLLRACACLAPRTTPRTSRPKRTGSNRPSGRRRVSPRRLKYLFLRVPGHLTSSFLP